MSADRSPGKPPSASVSALAAKLRVRADVLATLADASGDLPASLEARLLHAQEAGAEVASRAKLGAAAGDTIANILVDYVLRTQREAPDNEAQPDQDGLAVLKDDALSAIRAAAGPDAERVAAGMIGQL